MKKKQIAVVAIGGNYLSDGRSGSQDQMLRAQKAGKLIEILVKRDFNVVVVHGNGPQVGLTYLRQLTGAKENIPPLNLALCDAVTQAEIGTMLELAIINRLNQHIPGFDVLTIVSQVEVAADDPAFDKPVKPIGPFYARNELEELRVEFPDWTFVEDAGRGFRRTVPSPKPVKVFAASNLHDAFRSAQVVIAGGGGGVPVVRKKSHTFELIDAVIDKDRTACLIALEIEASHFFLLTGVPHVCINYGKPDEESVFDLPVAQAKRYLAEGHFPPGSMGPKIETAVEFAEKTGGTAIISSVESIGESLDKDRGTRVHV